MKKHLTTCFGAMALVFASTGVSADNDKSWYVSPMARYMIADVDREADEDLGFQVGIGKMLSDDWAVELRYFENDLELEDTALQNAGAALEQQGIGFDFLHFYSTGRIAPFALAGVAAQKSEFASACITAASQPCEDVKNAIFDVGAGVLFGLNESRTASLRADVRFHYDLLDKQTNGYTEFGDWVVSAGLLVPFGKTSEPAPAPVPAAPLDSDGDGVADSADACPNTTAGRSVNSAGCDLDSDGDGIPDHLDRCPATPAGASVDTNGCEIQEIIDIKQDVINLRGVKFNSNSATLTPAAMAILDEVAGTLNRHPKVEAELGGYTDSRGAASYNMALSKRRADSAKAYLVQLGVAANRLTSIGYGEASPIADNNTAAGREENRRVEMRITAR